MIIREINPQDYDALWRIFHEVVAKADTYAYPKETTQTEAIELWVNYPRKTYVVEEEGQVIGTYYIKTNQVGQGSHVCNCGYMVSSHARGKGVASMMCEHSQQIAKELGYKAMQFNFVASSNTGALSLWKKLGFEQVGQLPKAFDHPALGYIDAVVMYKWL